MIKTKRDNSGILMVLSPAKSLDLSSYAPPSSSSLSSSCSVTTTSPDCDIAKTKLIMEAMKSRTEPQLAKLLGISSSLAKTAHDYWSNMEVDVTQRKDASCSNVVKPCIYAFSGTAYAGLNVTTLSARGMEYLQDNLRIIDPLYGILRPLDMMQPYRLEMATRNVFPRNNNDGDNTKLASWWQPSVTKRLSDELMKRSDMILLNLASDEYSAAVDTKRLPEGTQFVRVVFREQGRVIAVHAKRARGLMARYLAERGADSLDDVKSFNVEGYSFVNDESNETTIVFDRKRQAQKKRTSKPKATAKKPAAKKRRS